jgi:hypothetical protein
MNETFGGIDKISELSDNPMGTDGFEFIEYVRVLGPSIGSYPSRCGRAARRGNRKK